MRIAFFRERITDEWWTAYLWKAISEDEVKYVMENMYSCTNHIDRYQCTVKNHQVDMIVNRAFLHGWDFHSSFDRESYEGRFV